MSESIPSPAPGRKRRRRADRIIWWAGWLALLTLLGLYLLLFIASDRWWLATLVMFGPRWVWGLPLLILLPAALIASRRTLWVLAAGVVFWLGPIMGLSLGGLFDRPAPGGASLRLLTCNTHSEQLDADALAELVAQTHPDVVVLEEVVYWHQVPFLDEPGWFKATRGELVVASRYPVVIAEQRQGHSAQMHGAALSCRVMLPSGPIRVIAVHLTSPHAVVSAALRLEPWGRAGIRGNSRTRRSEAEDLRDQAAKSIEPVILAGDFNLTADSTIYRSNLASLQDAFASASIGLGWTYFHQVTATRIDHILFGKQWTCSQCWVGPSVESDHRPLLADLTLNVTPKTN